MVTALYVLLNTLMQFNSPIEYNAFGSNLNGERENICKCQHVTFFWSAGIKAAVSEAEN